jgi:DNA-binding NarL/FixJ family response regulator
MKIVIHLSNDFIAEALSQLLVTNGYDAVVVGGEYRTNGLEPAVLLVDVASVRHARPVQYQNAKVLLMDTGAEPEKLFTTLLCHSVHGILSPSTGLRLFRKALATVTGGETWIDNEKVKALLQETGAISKTGKISRTSDREKEIIDLVRHGLMNKETAERLALSEYAVKAHLINIFRKFRITSRSRLITLAMG